MTGRGEVVSLFAFLLDSTSRCLFWPIALSYLAKTLGIEREDVLSSHKFPQNQAASENHEKFHSPPPCKVTKCRWENTQNPSGRGKKPGSTTLLLCVCAFSFTENEIPRRRLK